MPVSRSETEGGAGVTPQKAKPPRALRPPRVVANVIGAKRDSENPTPPPLLSQAPVGDNHGSGSSVQNTTPAARDTAPGSTGLWHQGELAAIQEGKRPLTIARMVIETDRRLQGRS